MTSSTALHVCCVCGCLSGQEYRHKGVACLDEEVQGAHEAALGLADALLDLVLAQLGVGLEAHAEPGLRRAIGQEELEGNKQEACARMRSTFSTYHADEKARLLA